MRMPWSGRGFVGSWGSSGQELDDDGWAVGVVLVLLWRRCSRGMDMP
jgi:hypothetical protein